ncbi:hypothetical protein CFP56_033201 [Quercus suber]|uniref:Uncharacterized protein n=1 Tax=Quercus suber TaxID=58331 RepID=A0AAW0MAK5_QUESU
MGLVERVPVTYSFDSSPRDVLDGKNVEVAPSSITCTNNITSNLFRKRKEHHKGKQIEKEKSLPMKVMSTNFSSPAQMTLVNILVIYVKKNET